MSQNFQPGDVAMVTMVDGTSLRALVAERPQAQERGRPMPLQFLYATQGYDVVGDLAPGTTVRPLVVIDPEDLSAIIRLAKARQAAWDRDFPHTQVSAMQEALREFADPKPSKPDEPKGLGAVVLDAKGDDWHRTRDGRWVTANGLHSRNSGWYLIDAVRVLSEGVTA